MRHNQLIKKTDNREYFCRQLDEENYKEACVFKRGSNYALVFFSDGYDCINVFKGPEFYSHGWERKTKKETEDFIGRDIFKKMIKR
jgi:hypothetical protein